MNIFITIYMQEQMREISHLLLLHVMVNPIYYRKYPLVIESSYRDPITENLRVFCLWAISEETLIIIIIIIIM